MFERPWDNQQQNDSYSMLKWNIPAKSTQARWRRFTRISNFSASILYFFFDLVRDKLFRFLQRQGEIRKPMKLWSIMPWKREFTFSCDSWIESFLKKIIKINKYIKCCINYLWWYNFLFLAIGNGFILKFNILSSIFLRFNQNAIWN